MITRQETSDHGTFGTLLTDTGFTCRTGELPWRDQDGNGISDRRLSCINPGLYVCRWVLSPRLNRFRYRLENVPGRDGILIHGGNFAGDVTKGLRCDAQGCILLGTMIGTAGGQRSLFESRSALAAFELEMGGEDFELTIEAVPVRKAA